jgi:hypothetical protein
MNIGYLTGILSRFHPKAAYVVVFDAEGQSFDVLPLLTMTGLHHSSDGIENHSAD